MDYAPSPAMVRGSVEFADDGIGPTVFRTLMKDETDEDLERQLRESFGRMRSRDSGMAEAPPADEAEGMAEASIPAKLFIGPNATWYDDRWRWMDWRGKSRSWNSAAAFTFGGWFAYRRMFGWFWLYFAWMGVMLFALMSGVPAALPIALQALVMVASGLYGNTLYLRHFRRVGRDVARRHQSHEEQLRAVTSEGGVAPAATYAAPLALLALAVAIGFALNAMGAGPTINF